MNHDTIRALVEHGYADGVLTTAKSVDAIGDIRQRWNDSSAKVAFDAAIAADVCKWTRDDDGNYDTACDSAYGRDGATPQDESVVFCPHCGRRVEVVS